MTTPSGPIRVGVTGAAGRMGSAVCDAVSAQEDLALVAAVDPSAVGSMVHGVAIDAGPEAFVSAGCDVVVDFTVAAAARSTLPFLARHSIHAVVGTTGLTSADLDDLRVAFTSSNCAVVANFAISAVLMMRFAEIAAPFFDTAEIIELHHDRKIDAPSGTAVVTAERMAAASSDWADDPTTHEVYSGARGGTAAAGIRIHSVRMRGMVAHQEVILGADGQTLTIRQDSYDRLSFMPGVLLACRRVADQPGLTLGLEAFLGL